MQSAAAAAARRCSSLGRGSLLRRRSLPASAGAAAGSAGAAARPGHGAGLGWRALCASSASSAASSPEAAAEALVENVAKGGGRIDVRGCGVRGLGVDQDQSMDQLAGWFDILNRIASVVIQEANTYITPHNSRCSWSWSGPGTLRCVCGRVSIRHIMSVVSIGVRCAHFGVGASIPIGPTPQHHTTPTPHSPRPPRRSWCSGRSSATTCSRSIGTTRCARFSSCNVDC